MNIRKAEITDAEAITNVHVKTWQSAYRGLISDEILDNIDYNKRYNLWNDVLSEDKEDSFLYVAEVNEKIVGFLSGGPSRTEDMDYKGEIYGFYILPVYQRQGIGQELFNRAVKFFLNRNINSMLIWVLKDNPAINFYKKMGGKRLQKADIEISGERYTEISFGWENLRNPRS